MLSIRQVITLLCFAALSSFPATADAEGTCNISTLRVTGTNSLFAVACRCGTAPEFLGRAVRFLDPLIPDSVAQEEVTVDCIEHRKPQLARACARSSAEFERRAAHVLEECLNTRPVNPTTEGMRPFTFKKDRCATDFRELDVERMEVLLACGCLQRPGYIVNPGVIQFITNGSPIGASEEQQFLQQCTNEAMIQLNDACRNMPERFELRGAQAFNVCCKRARVLFDEAKLECQATVPDDISQIDLTFAE